MTVRVPAVSEKTQKRAVGLALVWMALSGALVPWAERQLPATYAAGHLLTIFVYAAMSAWQIMSIAALATVGLWILWSAR